MTFDNRVASDLTEASFEAALAVMRRFSDQTGQQIAISPRYIMRPPDLTDEEFERMRQKAIEALAPEVRERYGC